MVVSSALIGGFGPRAKCLMDTPRKKSFLNSCRWRLAGKQLTKDVIIRQKAQNNFIEFIMFMLCYSCSSCCCIRDASFTNIICVYDKLLVETRLNVYSLSFDCVLNMNMIWCFFIYTSLCVRSIIHVYWWGTSDEDRRIRKSRVVDKSFLHRYSLLLEISIDDTIKS